MRHPIQQEHRSETVVPHLESLVAHLKAQLAAREEELTTLRAREARLREALAHLVSRLDANIDELARARQDKDRSMAARDISEIRLCELAPVRVMVLGCLALADAPVQE